MTKKMSLPAYVEMPDGAFKSLEDCTVGEIRAALKAENDHSRVLMFRRLLRYAKAWNARDTELLSARLLLPGRPLNA